MSTAPVSEPFVFSPADSEGSGGTGAGRVDPLVDQTRREIADIVREVAVAVRSQRSKDEFLSLLSDRILRAMAAEGVLVWRRESSSAERRPGNDNEELNCVIRCVQRLGRVTDQSIAEASVPVHARLIREVLAEGQPVVVPPTPGASDASVPANPTETPVALAPIELEPSPDGAEYLLEAFLEPECGVATQRGYLRFVAQMADLAGEFLRAAQLRDLRRQRDLASCVDTALTALHSINDRRRLEAAIVDQAAEQFGFDRVGLCIGDKLVAVSHVETIDTRSESATQIIEAASIDVPADGCAWMDRNPPTAADGLVVRAVVASPTIQQADFPDSEPRIVCLQVADAISIDRECRSELRRFTQHAMLAYQNTTRLESIPGGRLLASVAPIMHSRRSRLLRTIVMTWIATTVCLLTALFPLPLVVSSSATIRPANVQTVMTPRDAIVDQIHVRHGQHVMPGDRLLTLIDPKLDEQIAALSGRRAVLIQQQSHWTGALVDTASHQLDRLERVQGEQRLVVEEIASIDEQLAVLRHAKQSLVIHAENGGTVDAWQIEDRLLSRPLRRGDLLLEVIAENSPWVVDARIRQTRVTHVERADDSESLTATVALDANLSQTYTAKLIQMGPAIAEDEVTSTAALLRIDDDGAETFGMHQQTSHLAGAPARVMFHCGRAPAAYLLFQDVIRSVRGTMALYWGGHSLSSEDEAPS